MGGCARVHERIVHRCNIIMSSEGEKAAKNFPNVPQPMVETVRLHHECAKHVSWVRRSLLKVTLLLRVCLQNPTLFGEPNKTVCWRLSC